MAAIKTVTDIVDIGNGRIKEYGTWDANADSTTFILTSADASSAYSAGRVKIADIEEFGFANDADGKVDAAKDVNPNQVKITVAANTDTGDYWFIGKAR